MSQVKGIEDYDETYLECRSLAHNWQHIGFFRDAGYISRLATCTRCHMRRIQTMRQATGEYIGHPRYERPDGYSMEWMERAEFRKESIRRASGSLYSSQDQLLQAAEQQSRLVARKAAS